MLPRRARLTRHSFPTTGTRESTPSFSIVWGKSKDGGCAVVVSKAVVRSSVGRHLLKRRVLSVVSPWVRKDRFLVIHARKSATTRSFKELSQELTATLSRLP